VRRQARTLVRLENTRREARFTLTRARDGDAEALLRFRSLETLRELDDDDLSERLQLKHALNAAAVGEGFPDWAAFKRFCERAAEDRFINGAVGGSLNVWYAHHHQARAHLEKSGGYLLAHRGDLVIVEAEVLQGLDPEDPDWAAIGYDWVRPADEAAWARLSARLDAWRAAPKE